MIEKFCFVQFCLASSVGSMGSIEHGSMSLSWHDGTNWSLGLRFQGQPMVTGLERCEAAEAETLFWLLDV